MSKVDQNKLTVLPNKITLFGQKYTKERNRWLLPMPSLGNIPVFVDPATGSLDVIIEILKEDTSLGKEHLIDYIVIDHHHIALAYFEGLIPMKYLQDAVDKGDYLEVMIEIQSKEYKFRVYPADNMLEGCATYTAEGIVV